jgi:hypothetical protein
MRIRDGKNSDPGWKKVGYGIRDKHPGSVTLERIIQKTIPLILYFYYKAVGVGGGGIRNFEAAYQILSEVM